MPTDEQKQAQQAEQYKSNTTTAEGIDGGREASTQELILELRRSGPLGPTVNGLMLAAARRLEEQELELVETLRERRKTVANLIDQRDAACDQIKNSKIVHQAICHAASRAEPSRLELAGQIYSNSKDISPWQALSAADAIIAATKH